MKKIKSEINNFNLGLDIKLLLRNKINEVLLYNSGQLEEKLVQNINYNLFYYRHEYSRYTKFIPKKRHRKNSIISLSKYRKNETHRKGLITILPC